MKTRTRQLTQEVREALLALPDTLLMETLNEWFDLAGEHMACLDWVDAFKYELGYCVQSDETQTIYSIIDEYCEAEPDGYSFSWLAPDIKTLRASLTVERVYHTVVQLAGEALKEQMYEQHWESPPSSYSDGYDFMRRLAVYLRTKALPKLENGHPVFSIFPQEATCKRRPMHSPGKAMPIFMGRSSRNLEEE